MEETGWEWDLEMEETGRSSRGPELVVEERESALLRRVIKPREDGLGQAEGGAGWGQAQAGLREGRTGPPPPRPRASEWQ